MRDIERPPRASRSALRQLWSLPPNKQQLLAPLREQVRVCTKCPHLAASRTQTVFGVGNADADLMFIGEAPGADEDARGEPFVGRAGQLLTRIIETMGFTRADVYIANVLKCRPDMPLGSSGNRPPTPQEMQTCLPYLAAQIEIIRPRVLVALGATAVEGLARISRDDARIARPMAFLRKHAAHDHVSPVVFVAQSGAFGKTKSLGRHAASARAIGATDHGKATRNYFA